MDRAEELLLKLRGDKRLDAEEFAVLVRAAGSPALAARAAELARAQTLASFGPGVFIRGLIEFTSFCRNDCFYCGLRRGNARAERYRLASGDVLACCREGHALGFRTFVLQGGEDNFFSDDVLVPLVAEIKSAFPDCAVTLSAGERPEGSLRSLFASGADRYLLRHETADAEHYARLHPPGMTLSRRKECLFRLKEIGYQTGSGFMVGSPGQTPETLAADLAFLRELEPEMVGLGPFIPHRDTPFAASPAGSVELTLFLLSLVRLMLPGCLIPATTALATLADDGRERGLLAGANVVMPNLSPAVVRGKYSLYDGKAASGAEAAENLSGLRKRLEGIGLRVVVNRGDHAGHAGHEGRNEG